MPVFELIVSRNPVRTQLPAALEQRLARKVAPAARAASTAGGPVSPRASALRLRAQKNEERAAAARARLAAKENAVRSALERRLEVASELKHKALNSTVTKARDVSQKVKAVRLRSQKAEAAHKAAKEAALAAELARGAALHLAAVEERRGRAHAANERVSRVSELARESSTASAQSLLNTIASKEQRAESNRLQHIRHSLNTVVRTLFRADAAAARKHMADAVNTRTAKAAIDEALMHATELREEALQAVKDKAAKANAKAAVAVAGAKQAALLRSQEILMRTEQRLHAAELRRTARREKLLAAGEKLSSCGMFVIETDGAWRSIITPPASPSGGRASPRMLSPVAA